ncbi:aromatic acid exporter family protein [Streptomyces sp. 150FB]|uniref:FUSC family protein n=1 Tax=Streptomyces sp. 150FB TaxID=1576605 RepID=UPI000698715F|nr:aromatic acid exporter family protein [Streptomyces sp. 150FB]
MAAVAAWSLAKGLLPSTVTTFAPFTALLILQVTLYKSFRDCVQYLGAMLLGTALAAGLGATVGVHAWSLAVLILCALAIGRTQRLGYQGTQVSVIGIFAFSAGHGSLAYIGHLVASVGLGAVCAITLHFFLAPARRAGRSERAVEALSAQAQEVLTSIAAATAREESLEKKDLDDWMRQCASTSAGTARARAVIDHESENSRFNPRRARSGAADLLTRTPWAITLVDRSLWHVQSIVRSLSYATHDGEYGAMPREFLDPFSELLGRIAGILKQVLRQQHDPAELEDALRQAGTRCQALEVGNHTQQIASPALTALRGSLVTDIGRLLDELQQHVPRRTSVPGPHHQVTNR